MKLVQAEKVAGGLLGRIDRASTGSTMPVELRLSTEEQVAIKVLHRFAQRLVQAKSSLRSLMLAILGKDELNQEDLFSSDDEKGGGA